MSYTRLQVDLAPLVALWFGVLQLERDHLSATAAEGPHQVILDNTEAPPSLPEPFF